MSYGIKFVIDFLTKRFGKRVAKQILYVILMVFNVDRKTIRDALGASDVTLCKYSAAIKEEKLESVFEQNYNRPQSELEEYREHIEKEFEERPPATRREAAIAIENLTGMQRGLTQVGKFLKKGASKVAP